MQNGYGTRCYMKIFPFWMQCNDDMDSGHKQIKPDKDAEREQSAFVFKTHDINSE